MQLLMEREARERELFGKRIADHDNSELISVDHGVDKPFVVPKAFLKQYLDLEALEIETFANAQQRYVRALQEGLEQQSVREAMKFPDVLPLESLMLNVQPMFESKLKLKAGSAVGDGFEWSYERDLLEEAAASINKGMEVIVPIFPPLLDLRFEVKPDISMPLKLQFDADSREGVVNVKLSSEIDVNMMDGTNTEKTKALDYCGSYVEARGGMSAHAALSVQAKVTAKVSICFVHVICAHLSVTASQEASAGVDLVVATPSNYKTPLHTALTEYVEYTDTDLRTFNDGWKNKQTVMGVGAWAYITLPWVQVYAGYSDVVSVVATALTCRHVSDKILVFDTINGGGSSGLGKGMLNSLSEWWEDFQHNSTSHNATPQDLLDATSFTVQVSFGI